MTHTRGRLQISIGNWIALAALLGGPAVGHFLMSRETALEVAHIKKEQAAITKQVADIRDAMDPTAQLAKEAAARETIAKLTMFTEFIQKTVTEMKTEQAEFRRETRAELKEFRDTLMRN